MLLTARLTSRLFYHCLVSKPEEVMKTEPTTVPNVNAVNAIQDLPGFLWTIAKLKMKWSSQWTQFMQLRKEAPKKFRTSMGFEPVTSRLQCDALPTKLWSHWRWSPDFFFQASSRNCITCVHCDDHFFISISFLPFIYEKFHISLIAKLLVVNMGLQRFPTTKEINIDNSQGINLQTGYHGSNRA